MTWVVWNVVLVRLEVVLASVQDSCTVWTNCTIGSEIILDAPDGTPRLRGSCRSVSVGARKVHGLRQTYHSLRNRFGRNRWNSKVMRFKWKLDSVNLEILQILTQGRCMVCA